MHRGKLYAILGVFTAAVLAMSGCSTTTDSNTATQTASATNAAQQTVSSDAIYVQVQSVENGTITALVGTMSQPSGQPDGATQQQGTPPQQPSGDSATQQQGTPPQQPSGDSTTQQQGTPPDQSSGSNDQSTPPEMPSGDGTQQGGPGGAGGMMGFTAGTETITFTVSDATVVSKQNGPESATAAVSDIAVGDILAVTLSSSNAAETIVIQSAGGAQDASAQGGQPGANFGGSDTVTNGTAATTIDTDTTIDGQAYASSGDDENALRVDGATVTLSNITVDKTGGASSNTENGDFYGMNAGLLATNGATVTISGATVTTNAVNGNGVFSYGTGTTVNISDSKIRTSMNNSGGIQTTGGATMNATNLDVETSGNSAAAIRSDRGGGDVNVSGALM